MNQKVFKLCCVCIAFIGVGTKGTSSRSSKILGAPALCFCSVGKFATMTTAFFTFQTLLLCGKYRPMPMDFDCVVTKQVYNGKVTKHHTILYKTFISQINIDN